MTTQCANKACGTRFRYFRSGKIYLIDFKSNANGAHHGRDVEYFWLCGSCSLKMRVSLNSDGNVILEDLEAASSPARQTAAITATLGSTRKLLTA